MTTLYSANLTQHMFAHTSVPMSVYAHPQASTVHLAPTLNAVRTIGPLSTVAISVNLLWSLRVPSPFQWPGEARTLCGKIWISIKEMADPNRSVLGWLCTGRDASEDRAPEHDDAGWASRARPPPCKSVQGMDKRVAISCISLPNMSKMILKKLIMESFVRTLAG
jgi:hypothetical protein